MTAEHVDDTRREQHALLRVSAAVIVATLMTLAASSAHAEPRFAVREAKHCSHCHINRTGGGMRTPFGVTFSHFLPSFPLENVFDPSLGESVAVGANLRLTNRTVLATTTVLEGTERTRDSQNSFDIPEGNVYLRLEAIPKHLTIYVDEIVSPEGASSREAFVMLHGLPADGYIKAGRILLPFGLRILDDAAFIRQETGFTYANQDLGIELGALVDPVSLSVAVSNGSLGGSDPNLAKQVSAHAVVLGSFWRVGASFAWNDTSTPDFDFMSYTLGSHAGVRLGRLVLLGELDWIRGVGGEERYEQLAFYSEANFQAAQGLQLRFNFEAFDPLRSLDENERDRFIFGVSWFPIQLFEIRAEYRMNRDIPQRVEANADEVVVELHGFL